MRTTIQYLLSTLTASMRPSRCRSILPGILAVILVLAQSAGAQLIVNVVETGGDNEATDTIAAKWTGQTFPVSVNNEPVPGLTIGAIYSVGTFGNHSPAFVDRNHRYTNAEPPTIPSYLLGGEYIMSGNDNRDNAGYTLDVTVSAAVRVYMLIDNRLGDAAAGGDNNNATPPTFGPTRMQWILDEGWAPLRNGWNRTADANLPDEIGIDEGADGGINQWYSIYSKDFPAGTFQLKQADNAGQNMYGVVVAPAPRVIPPLLWTVGMDDGGWPVGDGGGANASFVQENGTINALPGSPTSPEVAQQADNDYYFAGDYSTVIAGNGAYAPVGVVAANEEAAERAFAAADNDLRYHFNLPTSLRPNDVLSVTFDANNLHDGQADTRYGVEVWVNGVKVQNEILIRAAQLDVDYTTPLFSLASVGAVTGPGADNIVSLRGINYNAEGGGNWMGIDYVQLNAAEGVAPGYLQKVRFNDLGNSVAFSNLLENPKYINDQFDSQCLRTDFSANDADECDNCGLVVRGYFIPKATGPHTFYFAADDGGGLFLSTDENPANKTLIAVEPVWSARKTYTGPANSGDQRATTPSPSGGPQANISGPITLIAGNRYYIEGAVKEAGGGDNIDVAVQGPGDPPVVNGAVGISGDRIAAIVDVTGSSLAITQNPVVARVPEGGEASFTVAATGGSPLCGGTTTYQWQRKGSSEANYADIAGANSPTYTFGPVRTDDHLASYRCVVRVPGLSRTSAAADLEVLPSECLRVVSAAGSGDLKHVTVAFSTFINPTNDATLDEFSYVVTGPGGALVVADVVVNSDGKSVTLTLDPDRLAVDTDYSVEVTGVQSIIGSETCAAPGNQAAFKLIFSPGFVNKQYYRNWTQGGGSVDAFIAAAEAGEAAAAATSSCFVNLWQQNTSDEFENYGGRISGLFVPVASGPHVFYFSSDDFGRLFLSTDANPANKVLIAFEPQWNGRRQWLTPDRRGQTSPSGGPQDNISGPIELVAGQKYYLESWFTEGGGGDNMAVAVQGPGAPVPANDSSPITTGHIGTYLTPPVGASATITLQPVDVAGTEGGFASFTAAGNASSPLCGPAPTYQWFRNGVPIIGATGATLTYGPVTTADNGSLFKLRVAAVGVYAESAEAVLSVDSDIVPPVAVDVASGPAPFNVTITFNELLDPTTANDYLNYGVLGADPAVSVLSAVLQANGSNVVLTLDADLVVGRSYSVRIEFVKDLSLNEIVPVEIPFTLPTSGGYAAAVLADGPIAYWRFNDAPPTAINAGSLGAVANGTYNGGAASGSEAPRPPAFVGFEAGNAALQLNGTDAFVGTAISLMNSRPMFTISGWIRRNADQANRTGLWGQNDIVEFGYIDNNTIQLWTDNGLNVTPNPIPNMEWAHFAIVSEGSGGTASTYTNGVLAVTRTHTLPADNAFFFNIGGGGVFDGTGNFFNGQIDEVAVYGTALTAAQIQRQYSSAFITPGFSFDDCATPDGTALYGSGAPNGTIADDGSGRNCVLHLTDAVNSAWGAFLINNRLGSANVNEINVKWRSLIGGGAAGGADGYSFSWAADLPNPPGYGNPGEEGAGTGLRFNVDTWDNGGGDLPGIQIIYQGAQVAFQQMGKDAPIAPATTFLRKSAFVNAEASVSSSGVATFTYDGVTITATLPGWGGIAGGNFMFGARTGGANDNQWIDDIIISAESAGGEPASVTITLEPVDQTFLINPPDGVPPVPVTFTTAATATMPGNPNPPLTYQWSRNGTPIPGATSASYTFTPVLGDNGAKYQCVASTIGASASTREATLTVVQRNTPPQFTCGPAPAPAECGGAGTVTILNWATDIQAHSYTRAEPILYGGDFSTVPPGSTSANRVLDVNTTDPLIRDGILKLTDAVNGSQGSFATPAVPGQIESLTATFKVRVGGGTCCGARTADGWSMSIGDIALPAIFPNGAEEGTGNGLVVSFDSWDNGGLDDAHTAPDLDIKVGGAIVAYQALAGVREGGRAPSGPYITDPATGTDMTYTTGDAFVDVRVHLDPDGTLDVDFKGVRIHDNIATGLSMPLVNARMVLAARTGGANDNHWIDDLLIVATAADASSAEAGQTVQFNVSNNNPGLFSAQPAVSPDGTLTYTLAPGATGSASVTVVAQDNGGTADGGQDTSAPCTFVVSVRDSVPPTITCPANITANADAGGSAVVTFAVTAADTCGQPSVVCAPASGSTFATGVTTVTCTATDGGGNTATCSFTVTVRPGSQPPTAVISSEQLIDLKPEYENPVLLSCNWWNACLVADGWTSSDPEGGDLTYLWTLGNDPVPFGAGPVVTNCLEVGQHTIHLTVTDPTGLQGTTSKTIEVVTAPLAIELLIEQIDHSSKAGLMLTRKIKRELIATLRVAVGHAGSEKLRETQKALDAFEKKVRAQVVPIDAEAARVWILWSQAVSQGMEKCIKPPRKSKDHYDDKKKDDEPR